ncbi:MAG: hypothetical protein NVSMB21_02250 [Vulcanimicrobiaceae bacterium]
MNTASGQKVVPLVSSSVAGPLGAIHLPRLWTKLTLHHAGVLPEGYDHAGAGFDQMTIDALGLKRDDVIAFVKDKKPTYMQFEKYVLEQNGGSIPKEKIEAHNAAVRGYNHADDLASKMQASSGAQAHVKDAVTLNTLEDMDELHAHVHGSH